MRSALASSLLAAALLLPASGCELVDKLEESGSSTQVVEVPGQHVSFEVPKDWDAVDADTVAEAGDDSGAWKDMADRMGVEPEQMKEMVSQADVLIAAPHAEGGLLSTINVLHFDGTALPSKAQFKMQFRSLGGKNIDTLPLSTDLGDGYRIEYTLPMRGDQLLGTALVILHGSVVLDITVTTASADKTEELADLVVNSLAETD